MANMADITTAAASDRGRASAPPPEGRASPSPSLPPSSPFPSLALPHPLSPLRGRPRQVRAQPPAAPEKGVAATATLLGSPRLAVWRVPGAQVNPRPLSVLTSTGPDTPLAGYEESAAQNSRAEQRDCAGREGKMSTGATAAPPRLSPPKAYF